MAGTYKDFKGDDDLTGIQSVVAQSLNPAAAVGWQRPLDAQNINQSKELQLLNR
jgi:hypothetical protein